MWRYHASSTPFPGAPGGVLRSEDRTNASPPRAVHGVRPPLPHTTAYIPESLRSCLGRLGDWDHDRERVGGRSHYLLPPRHGGPLTPPVLHASYEDEATMWGARAPSTPFPYFEESADSRFR